MHEILRTLRLDTNALGVWLLGLTDVLDNQHECEVLGADLQDESAEAPTRVLVAGEAYFQLGDTQLYAMAVEGATLVVRFDARSSLGLVRLRAIKAKQALAPLLRAR